MRRVAANIIVTGANTLLKQHVVEIMDDYAANIYPLKDEIPATEWLGGVIVLTCHRVSRLDDIKSVDDFFSEEDKTVTGTAFKKRYVYHVSSVNMQDLTFSPKSKISNITDNTNR